MKAKPELARTDRGREGYTDEEVMTCLLALVMCSGNVTTALEFLKQEKGLSPNKDTLHQWRRGKWAQQYDRLREKHVAELEATLAGDMREVAATALGVQMIALDQAKQRLLAGKEEDPARAAANLSRVMQVSTDRMLLLSGRPTQISESRDVAEILRGLVAIGVLEPPDVADATVVEEEEDAA
jgi:hypothetical protein